MNQIEKIYFAENKSSMKVKLGFNFAKMGLKGQAMTAQRK